MDSRDLLEITLETGEGSYLIPAHIWTPWFAVLGSKSGFDSIEECYADLTPHIFALETGLSSDPPMNWRLSSLDRFQLVSNSDAHSPAKIGREACVFTTEMDYFSMRSALETGEGYGGTIEFFPEEGKYHLDGHRKCRVCLSPEETRKNNGLCPICGNALTIGVMHRVDELADRASGVEDQSSVPFRSLVPLAEMLSEIQGVGCKSKKVQTVYESLVSYLGAELFILEHAPLDEIERKGSPLIAEGIARMRQARVVREAGFDGEYGTIRLFSDDEITQGTSVGLLFDLPVAKKAKQAKKKLLDSNGEETEKSASSQLLKKEVVSESVAENSHIYTFSSPSAGPLCALDLDQKIAAEITEGPLLIVAGPGTGKTRTLTHRISYLVTEQNISPEQCLALTFTKRATGEMTERLQRLMPALAASVPVMTFHALGYTILQEHGQCLGLSSSCRVPTEGERVALLGQELATSKGKAQRLLTKISRLKCRDDASPDDGEMAQIMTIYNQGVRKRGWVDFDDLIGLTVKLLESHKNLVTYYRERYRWVSVDEYQDIDARQYRLVQLLVPKNGNLCVIGDPDQAIYGFRGADVRFFQHFKKNFPTARIVQLTRNYRSGETIVQGALQLIASSTLVKERVLHALNKDTTKIVIHQSPTDRAEAEFVVHTVEQLIGGTTFFSMDSGRVEEGEGKGFSFSDFAVLYRTESQADPLCEAFARSGIPFQKRSHTPLMEQPIMQNVLRAISEMPPQRSLCHRLEQAVSKENSEENSLSPALLTVLETLAKCCGNNFARFQSELAISMDIDLWDPRADRVSLLTLHASKGLEFPVVFMVGCEDRILPLRWGDEKDANKDEERRLFFVGMTRARKRLFLSHTRRRRWRGSLKEMRISPFLLDIEKKLLEQEKLPSPNPRLSQSSQQLDLFQ